MLCNSGARNSLKSLTIVGSSAQISDADTAAMARFKNLTYLKIGESEPAGSINLKSLQNLNELTELSVNGRLEAIVDQNAFKALTKIHRRVVAKSR